MKYQKIAILILMIVSLFISLLVYADQSSFNSIPVDMRVIVENDYLLLYLNEESTEIALKEKKSGRVWFSNPINLAERETIARGKTKETMQSQFIIGFYRQKESMNAFGGSTISKMILMDNYHDSVIYKQFEIEKIKNGVRINYTLGQKWNPTDNIPKIIGKKEFEELLSEVKNPMVKKRLQKFYIPYSFIKDGGKNRVEISDMDQKKLFGEYSIYTEDETHLKLVKKLEELKTEYANFKGSEGEKKGLREQIGIYESKVADSKREIVWEVVHAIINNRVSRPSAKEMSRKDFEVFNDRTIYVYQNAPVFMEELFAETFKEIGYTPEDVVEAHNRNSIDPPAPNIDIFKIPVEYSLDGSDFLVNIPVGEIEYPKDALYINKNTAIKNYAVKPKKVTHPLNFINILPFFGAADSRENGYMFVPDGSGGLIELNNGKTNSEQYLVSVYGQDYAVEPQKSKTFQTKNVHFPVYGMKKGKSAFLGIIEDGSAVAKIKADISGKNSSFNTISAQFVTMPVTNVGFGASIAHGKDGVGGAEDVATVDDQLTKVTVWQKEIYQGDLRIRYLFMNDRSANYSGMANQFREYLIERYGMKQISKSNVNIPLYLELIGAIPIKKPIMGINMEVLEPLTTFTQAEKIINELEYHGVKDFKVKYSGLRDGGLAQKYPIKFSLLKELGGRDGFFSLNKYFIDRDYQIYPEISFLDIYSDGLFDGFDADNDASRFFNRLPARINEYNKANFEIIPQKFRYLLSPGKLDSTVDRFLQDYQKYKVQGIATAFMGRQVYGDYRENVDLLVDREEGRDIIESQFKKMYESNYKIMVSGGDDYTLPYVTDIINLPMSSSDYNLVDESIPFNQIVLHGLISFAGEPINLAADYKTTILKTIETGSFPFYKLFYRESSVVKNTSYDYLYTCDYRDWIEDVYTFYNRVNNDMKDLQDKYIINHQKICEGVYKTTYENNTEIIVNYNQKAVELDNLIIEGLSYKILKEGRN